MFLPNAFSFQPYRPPTLDTSHLQHFPYFPFPAMNFQSKYFSGQPTSFNYSTFMNTTTRYEAISNSASSSSNSPSSASTNGSLLCISKQDQLSPNGKSMKSSNGTKRF